MCIRDSTLTMANLGNEHSGVVRSYRKGWIFTYLNNTVHNGKYVGMGDNNQDLHQEDDAHTWGRSQIIKYATPDEQGTIRHYCSVDGCKGYYDEPYDYVEPSPDEPTPVTPVTPVTPDETPDSTPADEEITLTFWHTYGDAEEAQFKDVVLPLWEKAHPNIKIDAVRQDGGQFHEMIVTSFGTGASPDVARVDIANIAAYAAQGGLVALSDYPDFAELSLIHI